MVGRAIFLIGGLLVSLGGCANQTTQQRHEVGCLAGTVTGAVVGGLAGSLFGGGTGNLIMTAAGASAGTYAGNRLACGQGTDGQ